MPARKLAEFFMRFTIRELVLLTVIVALVVGWWVDRDRILRVNRKNKWHFYALLKIVGADGYSLEELGPGRSIKVRRPNGDVVASDDPYLGVPE
jgi:hypothetical protein